MISRMGWSPAALSGGAEQKKSPAEAGFLNFANYVFFLR